MAVTRSMSLAALALAAGGTLAACGGSSGYGSGGTTPPPSSSTSSIKISHTSLGDVLTDANGKTVYLFTHDSGGTSACTGGCESVWPYLTGKPSAGTGVDASLIGTITRSDGDTQPTYAGHPLYYYSGDSNAGDVNGEEIQNAWYVVNAQGDKVEPGAGATESPSTPASTGGGGY